MRRTSVVHGFQRGGDTLFVAKFGEFLKMLEHLGDDGPLELLLRWQEGCVLSRSVENQLAQGDVVFMI